MVNPEGSYKNQKDRQTHKLADYCNPHRYAPRVNRIAIGWLGSVRVHCQPIARPNYGLAWFSAGTLSHIETL